MVTTAKEKIEKAKRLQQLIKQRIEAKKEEDDLKAYFIREIGVGALQAENLVVIVGLGSRTDLDRPKLTEFLGEDNIKNFQITSSYKTVTVTLT